MGAILDWLCNSIFRGLPLFATATFINIKRETVYIYVIRINNMKFFQKFLQSQTFTNQYYFSSQVYVAYEAIISNKLSFK